MMMKAKIQLLNDDDVDCHRNVSNPLRRRYVDLLRESKEILLIKLFNRHDEEMRVFCLRVI